MFYVFAAILGFGWGGAIALESPLVAKLFGLSSHGAILGVVALSVLIGAATGPLVAGSVFDVTGSYSIAFLMCIVLSIVGLVLVLLLKPIGAEGGANDT